MYITFYSINNTIFNNNFFNNTENVQTDEDLANIWSYEEEGNYWSEYVGQDTNGDGIGDFPYVINLYNQDNYPLMGMFSDFSVYYMEIYYSVTIISNSTFLLLSLKLIMKLAIRYWASMLVEKMV